MTRHWFWLGLGGIGLVALVDRAIKVLSWQHQTFSFDAVLFVVQYSRNSQLALNVPGLISPWWWGIVGLLVAGAACRYAWHQRLTNPWLALGLVALGVGAASNGFDRLVYGGVIDYLTFFWLNGLTINLADVVITLGCGGILWQTHRPSNPA